MFLIKGVQSNDLSVHSGKHCPSDQRFTSCCDTVSLLWRPCPRQQRQSAGEVDRLFITSESLLQALNCILKDWTFKDWDIKSVISKRPLMVHCRKCWNTRIFPEASMRFYEILCPTLLADSRRFLMYVIQDYCPVVSRRFHIMSQSILSYFSIDTLSPSASAGRPGRAHAPRDANPLKKHKAQYRKRAAPENEGHVKSKVRKVIKPDRPASTQKRS